LTYNEAKGRGYGVIKLDLYGRGYSDNPDIIYNDRLFGDQVIELLDSLKINKKITLVGLSNGGRVISNIASRYYNRIEKLIYVSPSGFHDKNKAPDKSKVTDKEVDDFIKEKFPTLAKGQLSDFKYPENFAGIWDLKYEELLKYKGFARAILSTAKNNYLLDEVNSKIGKTDLPVFAIWGDSDAVLPFEEIENKILKIMPKLKLFIIEDSGHLPHMEQTNTFNRIFFDKILKNL
jgi:pimeloyl-ACP methyl ester carboxylesterase